MNDKLRILNFVVHYKKSPYDVYIGRPSKWGNPFSHKEKTLAKFKVATVEEAIEKYKEWILAQPDLIMEAKKELTGKILGCWCRPNRCHGDVLSEIVNGKETIMLEKETKEDIKSEVKEEKKFSIESLIGLAKDAAIDLAKKAGFKTRVAKEDGVENMLTMDYVDTRVNLTVKSGTVEDVKIG